MFPHTDREVLNDKVVIIHSSGLAGNPEIFKPYIEVRFPGVLGDVGGWSEALWEQCSLDASAKGLCSLAIRAGTPIMRPVTMPGMCFIAPLDALARVCVACPYCRPIDVIIMLGPTLVADDASSVSVCPKAFTHRWLVWSGSQVGPWRSYDLLCRAQWL